MLNRSRVLILGAALLVSTAYAADLKTTKGKEAGQANTQTQNLNTKKLNNTEETNIQAANFQDSAVAAEKWLAVLDSGNYPATWSDASATLKIKLPQESWVKIMEAMRKPLGTIKARKIIEQIPKVDPQGLPKGEYMIILYSSSFSNKSDAKELVILQQESNGEWRILTYQSS